jgi:hypothetical protein
MQCPLCQSSTVSDFFADKRRVYSRCDECLLIFVPSTFFLSPEAEKAEYDLHENSADDPGYRLFLSRVFEPTLARIFPGSSGLDFGSGPGPTLSKMFEEAGHRMAIYDIFYADDRSVFEQRYDFITATEVVEHLHRPRSTLDMLWGCLKAGGVLSIMTKLVRDREAFARWHYKNDMTHVAFFSRETFEWVATHWRAELTIVGADVIVLNKVASAL